MERKKRLNFYSRSSILLFIGIILIVSIALFFWFQWRPSHIKHNCSWIHVEKDEVEAIPGDASVVVPDLVLSDCSKMTDPWDLFNCHTSGTDKGRDNQTEVARLQKLHDGVPAIPAVDYWRQSTDDEYKFCLRSNGL